MVEINQRIFPYSIGMDLNHGEGGDYIVTISYLNINAIGKNATQKDRVFVVSIPATSLFEGSKKLSSIVPYPFYFRHLKVLVLGEELSRDEKQVREIVDGLSRDFNVNKKLLLAIAKGKAEDILRAVPKAAKQEVIEGSIYTLLNDTRTSSRFTSKSLTDLIKGIDQGAVIVPRLKIEGDDIKVFGECIFKNYAMIDHIGEIDNRSILFLKGEVKTELIDAPFREAKISYELSGQSMKRKLIKDGENLKVKIDIETEGTLEEYTINDKSEEDGEKMIREMEKSIKIVLENEINKTLEILQKDNKADAIGMGEYISKFHPKIWKEVEKDWDEVFSEMDIEVKVTPKIRRRGLIK